MFPQIPFGFLANTKITEATSSVTIQNVNVTSYVGFVRVGLVDLKIPDVTTKVNVGDLKEGVSFVQLPAISSKVIANKVEAISWGNMTEEQWATMTEDQWSEINE
ncbi:MAG: hypothetical protein IM613_12680 [Cytophagales bacterium]|jgi:hypothetical protein|nr:hypothetical protein [Cytophagales bacterium]